MGTMTNGSSFELKPNTKIKKPEKPLLVVVLDGWGEMADDEYNAISRADTPCMDALKNGKPDRWMLLKAHGHSRKASSFAPWVESRCVSPSMLLCKHAHQS